MFTRTLIATSAIALQMQLASADNRGEWWEAPTRTFWWDETTNKYEIGWFKSQTYLAMSKEQKMEELWSMIVPDINVVEEPAEYHWVEFPEYFTKDANGSFC